MNDDKLKELFDNYSPKLSSGTQFMSRMKRNMETIEFIKAQNVAVRRRYRKAIAAAAIAGFFVGVAFTFAMPYLTEMVVSLMEALPQNTLTEAIAGNYRLVVWPLIWITSLLIALNAYEISLSRQKRHAGL